MNRGLLSATLFCLACIPLPAGAAGPDPIPQGTYGDWSLYTYEENGYPVCYLASRMLKSNESVARHGGAFALITNRPAEGKRGVFSIVPGYPYQAASSVTVAIGRRQYHLFTDGDTAWAVDPQDPQIVAALHTGTTMVVTGHTKDGQATTDTYSLKGAGPALAALDKACPLPRRPPPGSGSSRKAKKAG